MDRRTVITALLASLGCSMTRAQQPSRLLLYSQSTGEFFYAASPVKKPIAVGYSGAAAHKNNPASACIGDLGPIPVGLYSIAPLADLTLPDGHVLKDSLRLTPKPGTNTCGRAGFLIHGDSKVFKGWASAGCIIAAKEDRLKLAKLGVDTLDVRVGR